MKRKKSLKILCVDTGVNKLKESKLLEALALVGLYPGDRFKLVGEDDVYYIDKNYGIFGRNDDIICNEKLGGVLSNPNSILKLPIISKKEKEILKALYMLGFRYIARDADLTLCAYKLLPYRDAADWCSDKVWLNFVDLPHFNEKIDFQYIRWEDKKPFDIEAFLEGEVYEG